MPGNGSSRDVAPTPTHAGGVVYRRTDGGDVEFLVVTARGRTREWVLPKGHVEEGEHPDETARREVAEEAGVLAEVVGPLSDVSRTVRSDPQVVRYYLMQERGQTRAKEDRGVAWLDSSAALERLTFDDSRAVLLEAIGRIG